jgi:hypothetical protein
MTHVSPVTWYARTNGNVFGGPRCCGKASTLYHVATMIACGWNIVPFPAMIFLGDGQIRGLVPRAHPHLVPIRTSVAGVDVRTVPIDQARWNGPRTVPSQISSLGPPIIELIRRGWSNTTCIEKHGRHPITRRSEDVPRFISQREGQRLSPDTVERGSDDEVSHHHHVDCVRQLGRPPHGSRIFCRWIGCCGCFDTSKRHIHSFIPVRPSQTPPFRIATEKRH